MALILKVSAKEKSDASLIRVYDVSGIYSAVLGNLSGWQNASTAFLTDVTAATITVYLTDTITLLPSTTSVTIDVYPTLPNIINTPYEVTAAMLGYTDGVIPDGIMTIEYNVTVTSGVVRTTYTASTDQLNYALVCCCTAELISTVDICNCSCDDESVKTALYAQSLLRGLQRAVSCNKEGKSIEILKALQSLCRSENCLTCK